jgi:hypothetical protein
MNPELDANLGILHSLSKNLSLSINLAEHEVRRSQGQLDSLIFSKGLVDESLNFLTSGTMPAINLPVALSSSGGIALPMCEQFNLSPPGSGRSVISDQIQNSILSGVSAFVAANPAEIKVRLAPLATLLTSHNEELVSLEERLRERLSKYSMHLQDILKGALQSYQDAGNKLRFTNAGNALRELLREFLVDVAPDNEVKKAPWFVPEKTSKNGVTRRHRLDYAIFKNLTHEKFPGSFAGQADETATKLLKDIDGLSELVHVTEDVLQKDYTEAAPLFASVMQRFLNLISAIETSRMLVDQDIAVEIQSHFDDIFTSEFFDALDILSTHTRPQGASDVEIEDVTFDENWIEFTGKGSVDCDLQYGSDGDVERGDGVESSDSFPFTFSGRVSIGDLTKIEIDKESISINTESFYE